MFIICILHVGRFYSTTVFFIPLCHGAAILQDNDKFLECNNLAICNFYIQHFANEVLYSGTIHVHDQHIFRITSFTLCDYNGISKQCSSDM